MPSICRVCTQPSQIMSQDQPTPPASDPPRPDSSGAEPNSSALPESVSDTPLTTESDSDLSVPAPAEPAPSVSSLEQVLRGVDQGWQVMQPFVRQGIQVLRQLLGAGWSQLLKRASQSKVYTKNKTQIDTVGQGLQSVWAQVLKPAWVQIVQPLGSQGLNLLRPRLPAPINSRLSDRGLTGLIVGLVLSLWWMITALSPHPAPKQVQAPIPTPVVPPPVVEMPLSDRSPPPLMEDELAPASESESEAEFAPQPELELGQELEPEPSAPPLPEVDQATEPATVAFLLPEGKIMEVQDQVAAITGQYSQDLIESVQANFQASLLMVQLSDRWYHLSPAEQDQLGAEVLQRSNKLDVKQLELRDSQGALVARNPVIGSNIIILQRHDVDRVRSS